MRRLFGLAVIVLSFLTGFSSPAFAHRVNIFAYADGDAIQIECFFSRSALVRNGKLSIYGADAETPIENAVTDESGKYRYVPTAAVVAAGHDLLIRLDAGEGHRGEWTVPFGELRALSGVRETFAPEPAAPAEPAKDKNVPAGRAEAPVLTARDLAAIERVVDDAVEAKLAPLRHMLASEAEFGPDLKDIVGGLGWFLGIFGILILIRERRR